MRKILPISLENLEDIIKNKLFDFVKPGLSITLTMDDKS